ncbi:MAG: Acetylene hydratase [Syntrophorhabdus sp. PtaU1.Bin058]|nr:MAG: Acetylene hydratase [Syntrophorhabdus sp. PtaU1.Bin058]
MSREILVKAKIPGAETGIEVKKTICLICGAQCGIDAYVKDGSLVKVEGTAENPVSRGTLCSKGASSRQWINNPERVHTPLLRTGPRGSGRFMPISWDEAFERIASGLTKIKEESGPESVVFFTGYPKWYRPFLKRLAHSFGSPNYFTESGTCFLATVMANHLTYGTTLWPDLKETKCILNWCRNAPYSQAPGYATYLNAASRGVKLIDVGPLSTTLSAQADIHLRLRPGTSGALALGLAHVIIEENLYDREFVENWTLGFEEYRSYVQGFPPKTTEEITGVPAETIVKAARLYASSESASIVQSPSVTVHHTNGIQNHRAITALIGLTGNFDRKGGNRVIPESYYHTPTGLKSREAEFEQSRPWEEMAPRVGQDRYPLWCSMMDEAQATALPFQIQSGKPYPIRAMLGFAVNYRMWPGSDFMKEGLEKLDFFVDTDLFMTDTAKLADIVLPSCSSFERRQLTMYSPRYAVWTEPVIPPVGESRSDVDIILDLARRLIPHDSLLLQGQEACLDWIFEPSGIKMDDIKKHPAGCFLENLPPIPYEKYRTSGFPTPSGKMEFTSLVLKNAGIDPLPVYREPAQSPLSTPDLAKEYPLILTTGARLPMFMHSRMYRVPWARNLRRDPMVDINPRDARARGIPPEGWVMLATPRESIRVKANITEFVPPGVVNMYHGFPSADANTLIDPDYRDPISGYPGFKSLLCQVIKIQDNGGNK